MFLRKIATRVFTAAAVIVSQFSDVYGLTATQIAGPFPDGRDTIAWEIFAATYSAYARLENDSAFVGRPVIYVANSGNDANPGTSGQPVQTLAGAATKLAAQTGPTIIAFKAGDIWRAVSGAGFNITGQKCKLTSYGPGIAPRFTRATQTLAGSNANWVLVSGTTYSISNAQFGGIACGGIVVEGYTAEKYAEPWWRWPFQGASSQGDCTSNPYSYWYSGGTLYLNFGSMTKNSVTFGIIDDAATSDYALEVQLGGSIIEHLQLVGWRKDADAVADNNNCNGLLINAGAHGGLSTVVRNMAFCSGSRHHLTVLSGTNGTNPRVCVADSRFGYWDSYNQSAIAVDPNAAAKPTFDFVADNLLFSGGFVSFKTYGARTKCDGIAFFRHGDTNPNADGACIISNIRSEIAKADKSLLWGDICNVGAIDGHIPATAWSGTTWDKYRNVLIRADFSATSGIPYTNFGVGDYQLYLDSVLDCTPHGATYSSAGGGNYSAIINCSGNIDGSRNTLNSYSLIHHTTATPSVRIHKSSIAFNNFGSLGGTQFVGLLDCSTEGTFTAAQMASATAELFDTSISYTGTLPTNPRLGWTNSNTNARNVALSESLLAVGSGVTAAAEHGNITSKVAFPDLAVNNYRPNVFAGAGGASTASGDRLARYRGYPSSIGAMDFYPVSPLSGTALRAGLGLAQPDLDTQLDSLSTGGGSLPTVDIKLPNAYMVPRTGTKKYRARVVVRNGAGALIDPDSNSVTLTYTDPESGTLPTLPATATRVSAGIYQVDVTIASTQDKDQTIIVDAACQISATGYVDSAVIQFTPTPPTSVTVGQ